MTKANTEKDNRSRYSIDLTGFDDAIALIAEDEGRSKSSAIRRLIEEALKARGLKK